VKNGVTSNSNLKNVQFRDFSKNARKKVEVGATLRVLLALPNLQIIYVLVTSRL
jgi:hypothetical protein